MNSHSTERLSGVADSAANPARLADDPRGLEAPPNRGQIDWDNLHAIVQEALERLRARGSSAAPGSFSIPGRSVAPAFALFSYRVFCRSRSDDDNAICVGVTIREQEASYLVEGEILGDETGFLYIEESFEAPKDSAGFADRVGFLADRLAAKEAVVLAAMAEGHEDQAGAR